MRHDDASYTYVMFNIVLYCVSYECLRMNVYLPLHTFRLLACIYCLFHNCMFWYVYMLYYMYSPRPKARRPQYFGHAPYKARPLRRSHYNKASILGFATEQFIRSPRWIIILSKYCIPISEKTQNRTKNSIFCRFFSFDDFKRHFYRIVKTNYLTVPIGRPVLVKLMVAFLSIRSLITLVFPVLHNRIEYSSWYKMRTCCSVWRTKQDYLSSKVFHTVLVAREYVKTSKTKKCGYIA